MDRVPYIAIAAALLLVYVPRILATRELVKAGKYDNHAPREALATLDGFGKRAVAAHQNGLEAFPMFAIAVLVAAHRGVNVDVVAWLSIAFVVARSLYVWAYLRDRATLRSGVWSLGTGVVGALLVLGIIGP